MRWSRVRMLLIVAAIAGCSGSGNEPTAPAAAPYAVALDVAPLVRQLGGDDADDAAERLAQLGEPVVPALQRALGAESKQTRLGIVDALAQMDTPRALDVLAGVARDDADPEVRATAVLQLGQAGKESARPALEAALLDQSPIVSQTAAVACGALCTSPASIDRVVDVGLESLPASDLPRMRAGMARLVAGRDTAAAARARTRIVAALEPSQPFERRARAAILAMPFDPSRAEPVLLDALRDGSPAIRPAVFDTLAQLGTVAAVPALEDATHDAHTALPALGALRAMAGRNVADAGTAAARFKLPMPVTDSH